MASLCVRSVSHLLWKRACLSSSSSAAAAAAAPALVHLGSKSTAAAAAAFHMTTTIRSFSATKSFSMDSLKELRASSGAPIVDCKKALEQTDGDMTAAMDWLREHGAAKASSKVAGRETTEGLIGLCISPNRKTASLVKVASETDFAGRSSKFVSLVLNVADAVMTADSVRDGILEDDAVLTVPTAAAAAAAATTTNDKQKSVKDLLDEAIVAIRENLSIPSAVKLQAADDSILVGYVHNKMESSNAGTASAIVEVAPLDKDKGIGVEILETAGKKLAMHIVAARPLYMTPDDVPAEEVEKERTILSKQLESTGKPPEIVEKIVMGRLRKFYESICLLEQNHMIEESNPKVGKVLKENGIVVKRFEAMYIG